MNCQHLQQMLAFVDRKSEELDAAERDAVKQHLEKCPDCAELAQAERQADQALGPLLRDVVVPAGLKQKVMNRLTAERGSSPWKWGGAVLAAVLLVGLGTAWYVQSLPNVSMSEVQAYPHLGAGWDKEKLEDYFAERGLRVVAPSDFDYDHLRQIEIVRFDGKHPVAKLSLHRDLGGDQRAEASVLIFPQRQFRTDSLPAERFHGATNILILHKNDFTYVIYYRGELEALRRPMN